MPSIAEKVSNLRAKSGWTLKELSERAGISVSYLNAIEKGTRPHPSFQYVAHLAKTFRVPLAYFSDSDDPTDAPSLPAQWDEHSSTISYDKPSQSDEATNANSHNSQSAVITALSQLYDEETQSFLISEQSRPYIAFARELSKQAIHGDPSRVLQLVAQFMREQKHEYNGS